MQVYQERRKIRRFLYSRAVIYALSVFVLFLLVSSIRIGIAAHRSKEARENSEAEYQRLLAQKERLDKKIEDLEDGEALEKEAKKRFNVTAPGEKVLIIVDRGSSGLDLEAAPQSAWEKFKNFFR